MVFGGFELVRFLLLFGGQRKKILTFLTKNLLFGVFNIFFLSVGRRDASIKKCTEWG